MWWDENLWRTIQYSCMFYMLALHEFLRCLLELKHCSLQLCAGQFINPHFIVSFYSVMEEAWFDGWGPAGLFPAKSVASQSSVAAGGLNQENVQFKILLWIMSLIWSLSRFHFAFCLSYASVLSNRTLAVTDNWEAMLKRTTVAFALETVPLVDWSEARLFLTCHLKNVGTRIHEHMSVVWFLDYCSLCWSIPSSQPQQHWINPGL